jgi:flagellar hook-associated protein 3 FlgL
MRITNKMMTNNMMSNINKNKNNVNTLEEQYSTGKKIQRPSDDPIVTVRALKLRTNLAELKQYYEKNIPDAMSWMEVTESALDTINSILQKINTYCVQGSTDTLTATDRNSIVQNLMEMKNQIYNEGNSSFAGRYVFTGYKTDSSLAFMKDEPNLHYNITESFTGKQIQFGSVVTGSYSLDDIQDPTEDFSTAPQLNNTFRIQLAYDKLDNTDIPSISYSYEGTGGTSVPQPPITNITRISAQDPNAYLPDADEVHFIPETGELILGADIYNALVNADNISLTYSKTGFKKEELMPEHYFNCTKDDITRPELAPVTYEKKPQHIQYEVNYNQKLTINTEGSDAISHQIGRCMEDIMNSVSDVLQTEEKISEVNKYLSRSDLTDDERARLEKLAEQLDTELELKKEIMQNCFERGISVSNAEQDNVNTALADLGSRYVRLQLTENRLSNQKTDFTDLLSKNEDVDIVDTIIKYNSAMNIYNASLSAAAKVLQNSLLDFL